VAWPDDAVFVGVDGDLHVVAQGGEGDPKEAALAAARCLNPHPEQVTDPEFLASEFFDARDAVQVKYEMVRKVRAGGAPVTEAAAAFGYSRPANYAASAALESAGLEGLAAARPGPRGGHKLTDEVCAWAEEQLAANPQLRAAQLVGPIEDAFGARAPPQHRTRAGPLPGAPPPKAAELSARWAADQITVIDARVLKVPEHAAPAQPDAEPA
jgi:hypothetical protein